MQGEITTGLLSLILSRQRRVDQFHGELEPLHGLQLSTNQLRCVTVTQSQCWDGLWTAPGYVPVSTMRRHWRAAVADRWAGNGDGAEWTAGLGRSRGRSVVVDHPIGLSSSGCQRAADWC